MTGGRLKRVAEHIGAEDFCLTYGDGVADIDLSALIRFHRAHERLATVTAVMPPGRYGALDVGTAGNVSRFVEKPLGDGGWINGGFFVLSPRVLDLIERDDVAWEQEPLARLAERDQLMAYRHSGFWQAMDTLRDKNLLEQLYSQGDAPWAVWR
jgi:glucose-1-phosphate cytidylyltransferase